MNEARNTIQLAAEIIDLRWACRRLVDYAFEGDGVPFEAFFSEVELQKIDTLLGEHRDLLVAYRTRVDAESERWQYNDQKQL